MIGHLSGEILFSDGLECILRTATGIGYQFYFHSVLAEGSQAQIFVSQIIKENSQELYGFENLRQKKLFELLLQVRGVGPKSAYALMSALEPAQIIEAVRTENKKLLTQAPGIGDKAASQIILDLSKKIHKINMYSDRVISRATPAVQVSLPLESLPAIDIDNLEEVTEQNSMQSILDEALMACRELGFKEDKVIALAQKVLSANTITRPEQLVHLVLKQI